jgi:CO dehydrogenase maturation factor
MPTGAAWHVPPAGSSGIRVVLTGKGGAGKTTLTALLAHFFARGGKRVLAVDGDPQRNLAVTLGVPPDEAERIVPVAQCAGYLREKTGAGLSQGGLLTLNPDVSDVVDRFSVTVPPGIRLLVMGGVQRAGAGCLCPEYTLLAAILRHLRLLPDDVVLLDTPAGLEHFGRSVADGFSCAVVVADPTHTALSVACESASLARQLGISQVVLAANRVHGTADRAKIQNRIGANGDFSRVVMVPFDPAVMQTEPAVGSLVSRDAAIMQGVRELAGMIAGGPLPIP